MATHGGYAQRLTRFMRGKYMYICITTRSALLCRCTIVFAANFLPVHKEAIGETCLQSDAYLGRIIC